MPILIPDYYAYTMADDYAEFVRVLEWYYMYCYYELGTSKKQYKQEFDELKDSYLTIFQYDDSQPPPQIHRIIAPYFQEIEDVLKKRVFTDNSVSKIADALNCFRDIEDTGTGSFRDLCLSYRIESASEVHYSDKLYEKVKTLLNNDEYDAAIVESFKYIDGLLQDVLQLPPHEFFGENIINAAFSQNTGRLQLKTTSSEQIGLRNFFSGANAIFRNPSAHRSQFGGKDATYVGYGEEFALTIVQLANLMSKMIASILYKNIDTDVKRILRNAAQNNKWTKELKTGQRYWVISRLPDSTGDGFFNFRVRVYLKCNVGDVSLIISAHDSVSLDSVNEIKDKLQQKTNLSTRIVQSK
jgi:uncharacterized protein (TIGR02391 family)